MQSPHYIPLLVVQGPHAVTVYQSAQQCTVTVGEMRQLHPHTAAKEMSLPELRGHVFMVLLQVGERAKKRTSFAGDQLRTVAS